MIYIFYIGISMKILNRFTNYCFPSKLKTLMSLLSFKKTETSSLIICIDVKSYTALEVFSVQAKNKTKDIMKLQYYIP